MSVFIEAWQRELKNFIVYTLSFVSALAFKEAIFNSILYKSVNMWLSAFVVSIFAVTIITITVVLDPEDN